MYDRPPPVLRQYHVRASCARPVGALSERDRKFLERWPEAIVANGRITFSTRRISVDVHLWWKLDYFDVRNHDASQAVQEAFRLLRKAVDVMGGQEFADHFGDRGVMLPGPTRATVIEEKVTLADNKPGSTDSHA